MKSNLIWIDENINNQKNTQYLLELESIGSLKVRKFKHIEKSINYMKYIEFEETKVIINYTLYTEFVKQFKENIVDICTVPKIAVFAKNKNDFLRSNPDYLKENNLFYSFGGVYESFEEIKKFVKNEIKIEKINKTDDAILTFERIDKKEKLLLPLFFKTLIDNVSDNNMKDYTSDLYNNYSNENNKNNKNINKIKELFDPISSIPNIPIEILSKYYARLYTLESNFYKSMNIDLGKNKVEKYLPFIKTLYEGVKLKSLPLASNNILYRGTKITNKEIEDIKKYINEKIEGLPSSIVFSKSFLSFSKEKSIAEKFLNQPNPDKKRLSKVLFILKKDDNVEYNLSTHGDIEKISFYPGEREVLFFPFSSFEIKDIKEIKIGKEKGYQIELLYLGKYLKDIENDSNLVINENTIPDSKFKNQLSEFGLIKKEKIKNINVKEIYNNYKIYEKQVNEIKIKRKNQIIGEIYISKGYEEAQIINSFENFKKKHRLNVKETDWKYENEKEIKENIEIKIDGKKIDFCYEYQFLKKGKYKIKYLFKNNFTKINHLFADCLYLTSLNFTNFNTKDVTDMSHLFDNCKYLKDLNLANFNTKNVTDMSYMFYYCNSLLDLNLSFFDTQNVINMSYMFEDCTKLTELDLSNFITNNVTNMNYMFYGCGSLSYLDLQNFNAQNVNEICDMFYSCKCLKKKNIKTKDIKILNDFEY